MAKQCLYWKPVTCKTVRGRDFESGMPDVISHRYHGNLISEIEKMPRREPISFTRAVQLASEKRREALLAHDGVKAARYFNEFLPFISECGYHIELTGDEFVFHLVSADC